MTEQIPQLSNVWSRKRKIVIAAIAIILFIAFIDVLKDGLKPLPPSQVQPPPQQQEVKRVEQPKTEPYSYVTQAGTLARQIEQMVIEVLGEKANLGKPRVIGIDVEKYKAVELQQYGYKANEEVLGITVKTNSSENITTNLQKQTMHKEAFAVLKNTFPLSAQIGDVIVWAHLPVKDKFGNTKDDIAITYSMTRSLFEKVNWGGLNYSELPNLLKSEARNDLRNAYTELVKF